MTRISIILLILSFNSALYSQCTNFKISADDSSICAPDIVKFTLENAIPGSTYIWDVGLGPTAGSDTFFAFYSNATYVDAKVAITLPNGTVCNIAVDSLVLVRNKPIPQFLVSDVLLCHGPDVVELIDITPNSASRNWIVDGSNYTLTNDTIEHFFVTTGLKTVSLIVVDSFGCEGVSKFIDTIEVLPELIFNFQPDIKRGCVPKVVTYSLTNDPSSPYNKSYSWQFPGSDNVKALGKGPHTRTYTKSGRFGGILTVKLNNGCTYVRDRSTVVALGDSIDLDIAIRNQTACENSPVEFELLNDSLVGFTKWSFSGVVGTIDSISETARFVYISDSGELGLTVVHNHNGCKSVKTVSVVADRDSVFANFYSPDHYHCDVPHLVHLFGDGRLGSASSLTYRWTISQGDSTVYSSTNQNDSFMFYEFMNQYDVTLIVDGDNGCSDTVKRNSFIYQDTMLLKFNPIPKVGCVGQSIFFRNDTKPTSYLSPDEFEWTFYDLDDSTILDTSTEHSPTMVYWDTGYYDVLLIGQNGIGCKDTLLKPDVIQIIEPSLGYDISDPAICEGDSITLIARSKPDSVDFTNTWRLIHNDSTYLYVGDTVNAKPYHLGDYDLEYTFDISGGCIRKDTSPFNVNGLVAQIRLDTSLYCTPANLYPSVEVLENFYSGSSDSTVEFLWSTNPSENVTIDDSSIANTRIRLLDEGLYNLNVVLTNSVGCNLGLVSDTVESGLSANFIVKDSSVCLGDTFNLYVELRDTLSTIEWNVVDYNSYELIRRDYNNYDLIIPDSGDFELELIIGQQSICSDSSQKMLRVNQVVADFASNDTFLTCAPVYVQFESLSKNADSLFWDFGNLDTNITVSKYAGVVFDKNTGITDGYDIQLIAKNNDGCADTAIKEDYVLVNGPIPYFRMENYIGCEPLEVEFIDSSIDADRFYINYNDGSELDSVKYSKHTYINKTSSLIQKIIPSIYVYDSLGCIAYFEPDEPVTIYKKPTAEFSLDVVQNCFPAEIDLLDTSKQRLSSKWLLNGDSVSRKRRETLTVQSLGQNEISLITTNKNLCSDTASKEFYVNGRPEIKIDFLDTICLNQPVRFTAFISYGTYVDSSNAFKYWNFGEEGSPDNIQYNKDTADFIFTKSGHKTVKFYLNSNASCQDSVALDLMVRGYEHIEVPKLKFVSFNSNTELEIQHYPSNDYRFKEYLYGRSDGLLTSNTDRNDTIWTDQFNNIPQNVLCYNINVQDICEIEGIPDIEHCFVLLSASSVRPYEIDLSWNHYVGWDSIQRYDIYRRIEDESAFSLIGQTAGDVNSYIDYGLCDVNYEYYVVARHPNQNFYSRSTLVMASPIYPVQNILSNIKNVSVSGEDEITIKWNKSENDRWSYYSLSKYESDLSQFVESYQLTDTFMIDKDVKTSQFSYIYRLKEADECDVFNEPNREGKSILLKVEYINASLLDWTFYRRWENGVISYTIEQIHKGDYTTLGQTDSNVNSFIDAEYHEDVFGPYCYRVYAINEIGDTSYSNIVCVIGDPKAYIPNAFTPNKDGLNEVFRPITSFFQSGIVDGLESYKFTIYNRWGEKVFETFDIREAWDGTFLGEDCQQDVYIYQLEALGVNDVQFTFKGNVTLLR